jgi:hypothetical protein
MFRRFLLLLLIALLPLQGVAASFMGACAGMPAEPAALSVQMSEHEMGVAGSDMPCHEHASTDAGVTPAGQQDQGCCHHLAAAIPPTFSLPGTMPARGPAYPAMLSSFTDHLPDRLQRPPLTLVI